MTHTRLISQHHRASIYTDTHYCMSLSSPLLFPSTMAKSRQHHHQSLSSYTVKSINKSIKVGDCVLMRPAETSRPSYVAKIEKIESDGKQHVNVHVRWYYRPEEAIGGRRQFHGSKELFLSDHFDIQSADTIEGICFVHSFKNYMKLDAVEIEDYFSRFEYNSKTGGFNPDRVAVFCKCEMPYNPDDLMVQCDNCEDWFHPACIEMTAEEVEKLDNFLCPVCTSESDPKKLDHTASKSSDTKVATKRRKR